MKIFVLSDLCLPSGFGRISNEVFTRLAHAHAITGASLLWDGILPPPVALPFHVAPLAGRDIWQYATTLIGMAQPDIVVCCQDFPYAQTLYKACRIDWSRTALLVITPIDGTPVFSEWLELVDEIDGALVISRFGVRACRASGRTVGLCHPGVNSAEFKPVAPDERAVLRRKVNVPPDAFIIGMMAMNQGRKNVPATLQAFAALARDKPDARLHLDMERIGPGGWNIPKLLPEIGIDPGKVSFKDDWTALTLRERYCALDVHSVISFREGFGLPLLESMACRIPAVALDWCSGTEICGEGRGVLIPTSGPPRYGTWGNAQDRDPDLLTLTTAYERLYREPGYRAYVAEQGYRWAKLQTWDNAASAVEEALDAALAHHKGVWGDVDKPAGRSREPGPAQCSSRLPGTAGEPKRDADRVGDHPGVQPIAAPAALHIEPAGNAGGVGGGTHPGGRRLDGIQPAGIADAGQGGAARGEPGLRRDVQQRSVGGDGDVSVLPELGHAGEDGSVAARNGEAVQ